MATQTRGVNNDPGGGLGSGVGGASGERHDTASGVDRGRAVAPIPTRCWRRCSPAGRVSFWLRQGAGEVRDAAAVWSTACLYRKPLRTRLFAGAFYLVAAAFEQSGMAGLSTSARPPWPGQAAARDRGFIRADRLGAQIAEQVADRFGWCCTGAPSSGCAVGERPVVLAADRGGAGRLRNAARAGAEPSGCRRVWPRPGSPVAACRVDRLAERRAGVRRRAPRRCPPGLDTARGSTVAALAASYQFLLDAAARVDSVAALALPGGLR